MKLCYVRKATITQQAGLFAHLPPVEEGVMAPPPEPPAREQGTRLSPSLLILPGPTPPTRQVALEHDS